MNSQPDAKLLKRYETSEFTTLNAMLAKNTGPEAAPLPMCGGEQACLTWISRGFCYDNCGRKATHIVAGRALIRDTHKLFDACGCPTLD